MLLCEKINRKERYDGIQKEVVIEHLHILQMEGNVRLRRYTEVIGIRFNCFKIKVKNGKEN